MTRKGIHLFFLFTVFSLLACQSPRLSNPDHHSAAEILGAADFPAICYSGYRGKSRAELPSKRQIKEDLKLISALGFKIIRTYNTQLYGQTPLILEAIKELKQADPHFEMYVMLGAWIQCKGAFGPNPDHSREDSTSNQAEISTAIAMARQYPDIVKILAVGNEAMVHWARNYFVSPAVILRWVEHLQALKAAGTLSASLWITSSDNFASWGGGSADYHSPELESLLQAVDYVSLHSYPFHDTHYNSDFWLVPASEDSLSRLAQVDSAMKRALEHVKNQYRSTQEYMLSLGIKKPIHIGESGWASHDNQLYGDQGSRAADEYKQRGFYKHMQQWCSAEGITCFFFEAFDEPWKDAHNAAGSENHFGLFTVAGQAKYAIWEAVDRGLLTALGRNGQSPVKSQGGDAELIKAKALAPPARSQAAQRRLRYFQPKHEAGETITAKIYLVHRQGFEPAKNDLITTPSAEIRLNAWEATSSIELSSQDLIRIIPQAKNWWAAALEMPGAGEDLSLFSKGHLIVGLRANPGSSFELGFQTGSYALGNQKNHSVYLGKGSQYPLSGDWQQLRLPLATLSNGSKLEDLSTLLFLKGEQANKNDSILIREVYYQRP